MRAHESSGQTRARVSTLILVWPGLKMTHGLSFLSVIGRGGEQINKLQSETGAKIQVAPGKL